jgi:hypothetical protein
MEGRAIFREDVDREAFLERLAAVVSEATVWPAGAIWP